jgi:uracil-DNA glycosylase family 4
MKIGSKRIMFVSQNPSHRITKFPHVWGGLDILDKQRLDESLKEVNLSMNDIFITNCVKCPTPQNDPPSKRQIEACKGHLYKEMMIIKPTAVVAMGNVAIDFFKGYSGLLRVQVVNMQHPAYIARTQHYDLLKRGLEPLKNIKIEEIT